MSGSGSVNLAIRRAERADMETVLDLIVALAHYEKLDPPDEGAMSRLRADGVAVSYFSVQGRPDKPPAVGKEQFEQAVGAWSDTPQPVGAERRP